MPQIKLLDGKKIDFDKSINGFELTKKISKSLEKVALIMEVDGELKDLSHQITKDSKVKIITPKDEEGLEVIRHDAAHIMAMAVQELFPGTQVTIGPVIENCKQMPLAYKIANIVTNCSIEPEAFGRVAVEAQSMGKPIIASDIGGSKETILNKKSGFLYKFDDPRELAKSLNTVIQLTEDELNLMGNEGRKNITKKFDIETMCNTNLSEYKKLLKN